MNTTATGSWHEANQSYLMAAVAIMREALDNHSGTAGGAPEAKERKEATDALRAASDAMPALPALETLCAAFGLTPFERDLLLLCAGVELDSTFSALCATVQDDPRRGYPTFALALGALQDAHWSALAPVSPLRRWRLVEVEKGELLTTSPLRIDERVLHYLVGVPYLDERLQGLVEPLPTPDEMLPSHSTLIQQIVGLWSRTEGRSAGPVINLCGAEDVAKRDIAATAAGALGLRAYAVQAADVPAAATEREALARLWDREVVLDGGALLLDCQDIDGTDALRPALSLLERLRCTLIISSGEPLLDRRRPIIRLDVHKPSPAEQRALWRRALEPLSRELNGQIETVTAQFNLGAFEIDAAGAEVLDTLSRKREAEPEAVVWEASRARSRPRLDDLAQRIEPVAQWEDLVLPEAQRHTLREIAAHVRQRLKVYEVWGFAAKGTRGLGISALFTGDSGTGKTMAGEILANELRLDLFRIDLSQVVSKYIGETEKNLKRVFDAAEQGGAILLFDEADALFGKRSEVKDSHDRYANIEVSYLLQRMETYRGLAILTTNMKGALDEAFLRRIRFVVQFPFPDAEQRAQIWRRIFPARTPTEGLDVTKLEGLNVAGGNIRNIALNAAFLAADADETVRMEHLLQAARSEYAKLEKPLTEMEIAGWA